MCFDENFGNFLKCFLVNLFKSKFLSLRIFYTVHLSEASFSQNWTFFKFLCKLIFLRAITNFWDFHGICLYEFFRVSIYYIWYMRLNCLKNISVCFIRFQICKDLRNHLSFHTFRSYSFLKFAFEELVESLHISKRVDRDIFAVHFLSLRFTKNIFGLILIRFTFASFTIEQVF